MSGDAGARFAQEVNFYWLQFLYHFITRQICLSEELVDNPRVLQWQQFWLSPKIRPPYILEERSTEPTAFGWTGRESYVYGVLKTLPGKKDWACGVSKPDPFVFHVHTSC